MFFRKKDFCNFAKTNNIGNHLISWDMPVIFNKNKREPDSGEIVDLQMRIEDLMSTLDNYRRFDIEDLRDIVEDMNEKLEIFPSAEEVANIEKKIDIIEDKFDDIDVDYDISDSDDHDMIQEELDDLLEDLEEIDIDSL